jgi:hypothetical protein
MKHLVHQQRDAGVVVSGQRQGNHGPGTATPGERGIRHELILAQSRDERVAKADEPSAGNRIVGDYEARLPVDQRDRSAQASTPEVSPIGFAGSSSIAEGGEGRGGIDLLGASVGRPERNRGRY